MISFLFAAMATWPSTPQVAFAARFYYAPGDQRTSYSQVYVCRLDGSHRRQLTFGRQEVTSPRWLGKNRLVWIAYGKTDTLVVYDLLKGRTVLRRSVPAGYAMQEPEERGDPVLEVASTRHLHVNSDLKIEPYTSTRFLIPYSGAWKWRLFDGSEIQSNAAQGQLEEAVFRYSYRGNDREVPCEGHPVVLTNDPVGRATYLTTYLGGASAGAEEVLYRFDPAAAKVSVVLRDTYLLDFVPGSRYWSGCAAGRGMSGYGKGKQVWTTELFVGDFQTGKRWKVASGLVLGSGIQIRPGV